MFMLKELMGILLVFSWIILSGFDVVEDLDLPDQIEFQSSTDAPATGNGSAGVLARNIVESADHTPSRCPKLLEQFAATITIYTPHLSHKVSKLHKVHRVFLI
jgi:hypothetical protein